MLSRYSTWCFVSLMQLKITVMGQNKPLSFVGNGNKFTLQFKCLKHGFYNRYNGGFRSAFHYVRTSFDFRYFLFIPMCHVPSECEKSTSIIAGKEYW